MANTKISALTALTGANVAANDALPIVDTNVTTTKKIDASELKIYMSDSPTLVTPNIGVATGTSLDVSGVLESGANAGTGGQLKMFGSTSGDVTLKVAAAAGTATVFQLPATNGTNTYALTTNGSGVTSWGQISLTAAVTGTLPVANGGTGLTSGTSGGVLYYSATGTLASSAALAANALVIGGGAGVAPSTTTTGTGILTFLGTPSSANLASAVTDETGSGALVFGSSPTIATPTITTSATGPLFIGGTGTTSTLALRSTSGVGTTGADIIFQTGNNGATEIARMENTGNLGVGLTAGGDIRFRVQGQGTTSAKYTIWTQNSTPANTFFVRDDGVVAMPLISSGAGTNALKFNTTGGFVTYDTSSARYKDDIRPSAYGLQSVKSLQSRMFEYKDSGRTDIGLIAEEVFPIIPELVTLDKDGKPDAVSYDRFVSVLVKAIQELSTKLEAAEARITALE